MQVVEGLDIEVLTRAVAAKVNLDPIKEDVRALTEKVAHVEHKFVDDTVVIKTIEAKIEGLEAQQSSAVERAGYVFKGPADVDAFVVLAGPMGKLSSKCLDQSQLCICGGEPG
jgi:hypothetical protein